MDEGSQSGQSLSPEELAIDAGVPPSKLKPEQLYATLRSWYDAGVSHSGQWRKQAREDFAFVAGHGQWTETERNFLMSDQGGKREPVTFNRALVIIKAVVGSEINSRLEITYLPRTESEGAVKKNEILSGASEWMDDESEAPHEQTRAFEDTAICGMGWIESKIDYDKDPEGAYVEKRINPLEMVWDAQARDDNLRDAQHIFHAKANIRLSDAKRMFPKVQDEDLHCPWASVQGEETESKPKEERFRREENAVAHDPKSTVTLVRAQWWEFDDVWLVRDPVTADGNVPDEQKQLYAQMLQQIGIDTEALPRLTLSEEQLRKYKTILMRLGIDESAMKMAKQARKAYKQAWCGRIILGEVEDCPVPSEFTFQCMTGEADTVKGTWYGLIASVRDPQRFANKWATQIVHILNTTARGGIIAERDAFEDPEEAESNYARPDSIVWASEGAIAKNKILPKPGGGNIAGFDRMLEMALSQIREGTGVNYELLGLRDANQPGILEHQRKQAAMTILARLFDSLRRLRRGIGRVRLHYIQEHIADGRMIRVLGEDGYKFVKLRPEAVKGKHDVVIEDGPTSPNQKEATWAVIQQMLPAIRDKLTPPLWLRILRYSPLPSRLIDDIEKELSQPDPKAEQRAAIADATALAEAEKTRAAAAKDRASADTTRIDGIAKLAELLAAGMVAGQVQQNARLIEALPSGPIAPMQNGQAVEPAATEAPV